MKIVYAGQKFEWDDEKNKRNKYKHGIDFEKAVSIFFDTNLITFYDDIHSNYEERFITIGWNIQTDVLTVCHCFREEDVIRIISARKATEKEKKFYFNGG